MSLRFWQTFRRLVLRRFRREESSAEAFDILPGSNADHPRLGCRYGFQDPHVGFDGDRSERPVDLDYKIYPEQLAGGFRSFYPAGQTGATCGEATVNIFKDLGNLIKTEEGQKALPLLATALTSIASNPTLLNLQAQGGSFLAQLIASEIGIGQDSLKLIATDITALAAQQAAPATAQK